MHILLERCAKETWNERAKTECLGMARPLLRNIATGRYGHTWMVLMGQGVTRNGSRDEKHLSSTDTPDFGVVKLQCCLSRQGRGTGRKVWAVVSRCNSCRCCD